MEEYKGTAPEFFMHDGKMNRRTFIKGVGAITVASAMGFAARPEEALASKGEAPAKEGERSVHAVCTVNCTSRCRPHAPSTARHDATFTAPFAMES